MSQSLRMSQFSMLVYVFEDLQLFFNYSLYRLWRKTGIPAAMAAFGRGWNVLERVVPGFAFANVLVVTVLFLVLLEILAAHGWVGLSITLAAIAGLYILLPVVGYLYYRLRG